MPYLLRSTLRATLLRHSPESTLSTGSLGASAASAEFVEREPCPPPALRVALAAGATPAAA